MARDPVIKVPREQGPPPFGEPSACAPIKVEIVFITVTEDRVVITTRCVHQLDLTLASTKVNQVLPACQPAAVTELASLGGCRLLKHLP